MFKKHFAVILIQVLYIKVTSRNQITKLCDNFALYMEMQK